MLPDLALCLAFNLSNSSFLQSYLNENLLMFVIDMGIDISIKGTFHTIGYVNRLFDEFDSIVAAYLYFLLLKKPCCHCTTHLQNV